MTVHALLIKKPSGRKNTNMVTLLHTSNTARDSLLKMSAPWLESVSICSLILLPGSQLQGAQGGSQRRRAGEGRQSSFLGGGHPLAENVNTPNINININMLLFQNTADVESCY